MKKCAVAGVLLLVLLLTLPGCGGPSVIKVGVIAELTGSMPAVGASCRDAAKLAVKEINDRGGIEVGDTSYQVELFIEDSAADPKKAASAAEKLIEEDGVVAIIGPNSSSNAVAAADVADEAGVLLIAPWSTNPKTTVDEKTGKPGKAVYRACFTDDFESDALGRFAREDLGAGRAAALYDDSTAVLVNQAELFKKSFEANGGQVVASETFKTGDADYTAQMVRIKAAAPDVLFLPSYYTDVAAQVRQARAAGITATFIGSDAWSTPELIRTGGADIEGSYLCNHYSSESPNTLTKRFVEAYQAEYGQVPDDVAALNYDSFGLLESAMTLAGKVERAAILEGMGKVESYRGATGQMLFGSGSHDPMKSGVIIQVKDGKFNWYSDIYPAPTRAQVESFVGEAVEFANDNGKEKALQVFSDRNGEFVRGELYIYAYDFDGNVIAHGGTPDLVGQNLIDMKDPNGVMVIQELRNLALGDGGWLEYMWNNPLTGKVEPKVGYVMKVDDTWWLGSGYYE